MSRHCNHIEIGRDPPLETMGLGWRDGPTSGLALCKLCNEAFYFEMIAEEAASEGDTRIYGLRAISSSSYTRLAALNAQEATSDEDAVTKANLLALAARDALAGGAQMDLYVAAADLSAEILGVAYVDFLRWSEILSLPPGQRRG